MADFNFLYSEETEDGYTNTVSAEDLNNIAIDLGIPEYSRFPEEPPQSAVAALNGITQDLTTKGVLQIGGKAEPTLSDSTVNIANGVIVFESGAKLRWSTNYSISGFVSGNHYYIYFLNIVTENRIALKGTTTPPDDSLDYVMIAELDEKGVLHDKRYWAISKVGTGVNVVKEFTQTFWHHPMYYNSSTGEFEDRHTLYEFDVSPHGANYFIGLFDGYTGSYPIAIPLIEGEEIRFSLDPGYSRYFDIKKEGSRVYISSFRSGGNKNNSTGSLSTNLTFYLV